jgi:hypothetical protein
MGASQYGNRQPARSQQAANTAPGLCSRSPYPPRKWQGVPGPWPWEFGQMCVFAERMACRDLTVVRDSIDHYDANPSITPGPLHLARAHQLGHSPKRVAPPWRNL